MKKTLNGPLGIKLVLDSSEIFPNDPGNGTPALVHYRGGIGSLTCVECEGYVDNRGRDISVPQECIDWLCSDFVQNAVEDMYANFSPVS